MKKRQSKHPYIMFAFLVLLNISILAMAIILYLCMKISAANYAMSIFVLFIPIIAGIFVFYNIIVHFLELKNLNKSEKL